MSKWYVGMDLSLLAPTMAIVQPESETVFALSFCPSSLLRHDMFQTYESDYMRWIIRPTADVREMLEMFQQFLREFKSMYKQDRIKNIGIEALLETEQIQPTAETRAMFNLFRDTFHAQVVSIQKGKQALIKARVSKPTSKESRLKDKLWYAHPSTDQDMTKWVKYHRFLAKNSSSIHKSKLPSLEAFMKHSRWPDLPKWIWGKEFEPHRRITKYLDHPYSDVMDAIGIAYALIS